MSNVAPKILFCDMEGTLLKKEYRLDDGLVAPSAWTLLAEKLGPECLRREQETKKKWLRKEYRNYVHWMRDTIEIHRESGLKKKLFDEVMDSVELMPGVFEAFRTLREWKTITVLISGGFKALADRVQRELQIDHSLCGCEYFWDSSGAIDHFNLLPSDEEAKAHFMQLICIDYGVRARDCAFVGDGKNDVHLARSVGFSVAFNAQEELAKVASVSINQGEGREDFREVTKVIAERFARDRRFPVPWALLFALMGLRRRT